MKRPSPGLRPALAALALLRGCQGLHARLPPGPLEGCRVCALAPASAPRLFIRRRDDGLGGTTHSVIYGMALAAHLGMNFGGMVNGEHRSHGVQLVRFSQEVGTVTRSAVANFFGVARPSLLFPPELPHVDATCASVPCVKQLMSGSNITDLPGANVLLEAYPLEAEGSLVPYLTLDFLAVLQSQVRPGRAARLRGRSAFRTRPGALAVALHARRGDVRKRQGRYTPNSWYLSAIRRIRRLAPAANIHLWSSTEGVHDASEFADFEAENVTVHLDGDPLDAWAHFVAADVFVMARSAFSSVPAYANPKCVVYQPGPTVYPPLNAWLVSSDMSPAPGFRKGFDAGLRACVARARASKGAPS